MKAVIIYSGGMDSTTLLYKFKNDIKLAVTFSYGARQDDMQIACARENCQILGIRHIVIPLGFIGEYFKSSILKGGDEVPEGNYNDDNMKSTVVPFRNGIMLSIACGIAESNDLKYVMIANHAGDHSIYPDCTPSFIKSMNEATMAGTYKKVEILAPYRSE